MAEARAVATSTASTVAAALPEIPSASMEVAPAVAADEGDVRHSRSRSRSRRRSRPAPRTPAFVALAIVAVGVAGWWLTGPSSGRAAVFSSENPDGPAVIALLSSHATQSSTGDFWYVQGEVKNLTEQRMSNVQAVTTWYDTKDVRIAIDNEMIDLKTLKPGQTSPFRTITRFRPNMSRYKVEFKSDLGGLLTVRNDTAEMPVVPAPSEAH